MILVLAVVLDSFVCSGRGRQLPWLLDPPLRYQALRRALGSTGAGLPSLDLGAGRVRVSPLRGCIVPRDIWGLRLPEWQLGCLFICAAKD